MIAKQKFIRCYGKLFKATTRAVLSPVTSIVLTAYFLFQGIVIDFQIDAGFFNGVLGALFQNDLFTALTYVYTVNMGVWVNRVFRKYSFEKRIMSYTILYWLLREWGWYGNLESILVQNTVLAAVAAMFTLIITGGFIVAMCHNLPFGWLDIAQPYETLVKQWKLFLKALRERFYFLWTYAIITYSVFKGTEIVILRIIMELR